MNKQGYPDESVPLYRISMHMHQHEQWRQLHLENTSMSITFWLWVDIIHKWSILVLFTPFSLLFWICCDYFVHSIFLLNHGSQKNVETAWEQQCSLFCMAYVPLSDQPYC